MKSTRKILLLLDDENGVVPGVVVDDEDFPDNVDVEDASKSEGQEGQPDCSVLDLYEKLFSLRSNPFGLERFSCKEKVQIRLMQLLSKSLP